MSFESLEWRRMMVQQFSLFLRCAISSNRATCKEEPKNYRNYPLTTYQPTLRSPQITRFVFQHIQTAIYQNMITEMPERCSNYIFQQIFFLLYGLATRSVYCRKWCLNTAKKEKKGRSVISRTRLSHRKLATTPQAVKH